MGGSVIQDHQDTKGKVLRHVILFQLVHQGHPAVCRENASRHPTTRIGVQMDRQAGLFIALECTRVLGMVDQDRLELAVFRQVSPQREGETVLKCFEARGRFLPRDVNVHSIALQWAVVVLGDWVDGYCAYYKR